MSTQSKNTSFDPQRELKDYQISDKAQTIDFVNTTCSKATILSKADRQKKNSLYLHTQKTKLAGAQYTLQVEGKDIALKAGTDLYKQICDNRASITAKNPQVSLKNLIIACDRLELHDDLILPECNVSIFTRELVIKKKLGIYTQPLKWNQSHAPDAHMGSPEEGTTRNGADGRNAGEVNLFAHTITGKPLTIYANGGQGQGAGKGLAGKDGESASKSYASQTFAITTAGVPDFLNKYTTKCTVKFIPVATYIKSCWRELEHVGPDQHRQQRGDEKKPTSGTNAKAPGKPGEPANGGNFCSNLPLSQNSLLYQAAGGKAGAAAVNVVGGKAGSPTHSAQYDLMFVYQYRGGTINHPRKNKKISETKTTSGKSYEAPQAQKPSGQAGEYKHIASTNAWLHPAQLKVILKYVRIEYLKNQNKKVTHQLKTILQVYLDALKQDLPGIDVWNERTFQIWTQSEQAIVALIVKMEGQKDYFNNPAGFMPLLSLSGSITLYKHNLKQAIQSLVLAKWLTHSQQKAQENKAIIAQAYDTIIAESKQLSIDLEKVKAQIKQVEGKHTNIESKLKELTSKLYRIQTRLLAKAKEETDKNAMIVFGLKMGAALLQVIPYAQPALGLAGNITSTLADNYGKSFSEKWKGIDDILKKNDLGEVLEKTQKGLKRIKENTDKQTKVNKALANTDNTSSDDIIKQIAVIGNRDRYVVFQQNIPINIKGQQPPKEDKKKDTKDKNKKASKWSQVSGNIGSAVSDVVAGFQALSVPETEVYAALEKLKGEDEEWNKVQREIADFTRKKAAFFKEFIKILEHYSMLDSRIQQNTVLALKLRDSIGKEVKLADEDVLEFAHRLEQRTKDQLVYQLYLMTKAYETTTFEALEVNWHTENIFDKITEQVKEKGKFSLSCLKMLVDALEPVFQENLQKIKDKILEFLSKHRLKKTTRYIRLNNAQIEELNQTKKITFSPLDFHCISPDFHLAKLQDLTCEIEFVGEVKDGKLENSILKLELNKTGIVRLQEKLYQVESIPRIFTWSFDPNGKPIKDEPSDTYHDLLKLLIKDKNALKKIALPPAWSDMTVSFNPTGKANQVKIKGVKFTCTFEEADANTTHAVMNVRSNLNVPGTTITLKNWKNSPESIQFIGNFYDISSIKNKVQLTAPAYANGQKFQKWVVKTKRGNIEQPNTTLEIDLSQEGLLYIQYDYAPIAKQSSMNTLPLGVTIVPVSQQAKQPSQHQSAFVEETAVALPILQNKEEPTSVHRIPEQPVFVSPSEGSEIIYFLDREDTVLEYQNEGDIPNGWAMISLPNLTGFIKSL